MKHALVTIALAALAATANAQEPYPPRPMTCDPLPPVELIQRGDKLEQHDPWRFELGPAAGYFTEIRQVTGGIVLNWMGGTPGWALEPEPDAFYAWEVGYASYCRHFSEGVDKTAQSGCHTDCVTVLGEQVHYRAMKWDARNGEWKVTAAAQLEVG
jgi:hypothetical protein